MRQTGHRGRIDHNQQELVRQLRQCGVHVQLLSSVGKGCPDLLCGFRGQNFLLEVKDGAKPIGDQRLTVDQKTWHETWPGQVAVVRNFTEAMEAIIRASQQRGAA